MIIRPMKAGPFVPEKIRYPTIGQPKYDGWRMLLSQQTPYTSRLKQYPNRYLHWYFSQLDASLLHGLDGEVAVGDHLAPDCYSVTESAVSSFGGEPDFTFFVFDAWDCPDRPFVERGEEATMRVSALGDSRVQIVQGRILNDETELLAYEEDMLSLGYEGIILRAPEGLYKQGRSTENQGWCIKVKRTVDSEAEIIGFEELVSNQNEAQTNELGLMKRSSHQANMVPMDTLGALLARDINPESEFFGVEFRVGVFKGLTKAQLKDIWDNRPQYLGRPFKYTYQKIGGYKKPRTPRWIGWRSELLL